MKTATNLLLATWAGIKKFFESFAERSFGSSTTYWYNDREVKPGSKEHEELKKKWNGMIDQFEETLKRSRM